jgi:squalene-hopene/tetraprenyl-beta-curcumene cyclase
VAALPFELAALPRLAWRFLRLPVVSYAAPALIAIGQARFRHCPPACPLTRLVRAFAASPTLRLLRAIQPASGGYLEAAPLTSFVLMSLCSIGQGGSATAVAAQEFLRSSVRPDGSWPIDTNLSVWLTSLAVNALAAGGRLDLPAQQLSRIKCWLLSCQHHRRHPYTGAAGGGWAWTDLSGGVPDADDTAGALLALHKLGPADEPTRQAAREGVMWLLDVQNRDGGIPTFCRGWGKLPFDRSSPDLTAHAILAWLAWHEQLGPALRRRMAAALAKAAEYLRGSRRQDGSWLPLWFGNQHAPDQQNGVYGTAKVVVALAELAIRPAAGQMTGELLLSGVEYLLSSRGQDGGWGGSTGVAPSIEETSLAVDALCAAWPAIGQLKPALETPTQQAIAAGAAWLIQRVAGAADLPAEPIGLYFARLWYFERLYPLIFATAALSRARALV